MADSANAPALSPSACSICGAPVETREELARVVLAIEGALAYAPRTGDAQLPAYLDAEIRPRLVAVAAELLGVHLACRLKEQAGLPTCAPEVIFEAGAKDARR